MGSLKPEKQKSQQHGTRAVVDAEQTGPKVPALLKMPREILEMICHHMDVDSFFVALHTCKAIFSAGLSESILLR